jgi:hypothetical protein
LHTCPPVHWFAVQLTAPPHPSLKRPQVPAGKSAQPLGVQHDRVLELQTCPLGQLPAHVTVPPQPSASVPQVPAGKSVQLFGVQHWPELHRWPPGQLLTWMVPPQPSSRDPHWLG